MRVVEEIELLQVALRVNELKDLNIRIVALLEVIMGHSENKFNKEELEFFNTLLESLMSALQNMDYQLLDDLLEFELKPFVAKIISSKEF